LRDLQNTFTASFKLLASSAANPERRSVIASGGAATVIKYGLVIPRLKKHWINSGVRTSSNSRRDFHHVRMTSYERQ
jgi:hypothetical protein